MPDRIESIDLTGHAEIDGTPAALYISRVVEEGLRYVRTEDWSTSARSLAEVGRPVLRVFGDAKDIALVELDGVVAQIGLYGGRVYASLASADESRLDGALATLRALLPAPDPSSAHEVPVTFWTYSPHGPQPSWRSIAVPAWSDIRANYSAPTRGRLEPIMHGFEPAHGGQLILWHGKAGTGKTFGLRALAWEWREWCEFHYIVDPDSFFGAHADYLMNVLMQPGYAQLGMPAEFHEGMVHPAESDGRERSWRLLVLEDTGELLTPDARSVIGQGLSRFLNVVDGLIGQGLRVLVLVTTNEEVRRLHPAVARPGRCAANVEFVPLAADEAVEWLAAHGQPADVDGAVTLASLYARTGGFDRGEAERAAGF